jgi:hypothetical protein
VEWTSCNSNLHVIVACYNEYKILQFLGLVTDSSVSLKILFLFGSVNGKQNLIPLFTVLNQSGSQLDSFMKKELHLVV